MQTTDKEKFNDLELLDNFPQRLEVLRAVNYIGTIKQLAKKAGIARGTIRYLLRKKKLTSIHDDICGHDISLSIEKATDYQCKDCIMCPTAYRKSVLSKEKNEKV